MQYLVPTWWPKFRNKSHSKVTPLKENFIYSPSQFLAKLQKHISSELDERQQQVLNVTENQNIKAPRRKCSSLSGSLQESNTNTSWQHHWNRIYNTTTDVKPWSQLFRIRNAKRIQKAPSQHTFKHMFLLLSIDFPLWCFAGSKTTTLTSSGIFV